MTSAADRKELSTAECFATLNRVGVALMRESDETRLLHLIAENACMLAGAEFAAFFLRSFQENSVSTPSSACEIFHLVNIIGITPEQEEVFRRMSLGGRGLLAPIFHEGRSLLIPDIAVYPPHSAMSSHAGVASPSHSSDQTGATDLHAVGLPPNHIPVRSFLGAPLLDHAHRIVGGLLLGHTLPDQFTVDDELLLSGLAAQAAVSLENAHLYRLTQRTAHELNAIFESITDGVALVDSVGVSIRENEKARSIRADLSRSGVSEPAFRELLSTPIQSALRGEMHKPVTVTVLDAQQEVHIYQVSVSPLRSSSLAESAALHSISDSYADIAGVVVVWNDVSAAHRLLVERRMNAETTVRYSLLQTFINKLPVDAYLVTGSDLRLIMTNQTSLTAWGARWLPGQSMLDFLKSGEIHVFDERGFPLEPKDFAAWRALLNREPVYQQQEVIHRKDGTAIPVLVNAVPLDLPLLHLSPTENSSLLDDKTVPCALIVHQDVSVLKDAEKLKDDFIAIAAHELRNPLAIIRGFAQTLLVQTGRGHGSRLDDWQLEALQGVDQSTTRMTELVDELMDVTRLQAGRLAFHFEPADLIALVQRVIHRLQVTTQKHTLLFRTDLEYAVANVDPHRTEQILSNVIVNAIKYSPQGGPIEMHIGMQAQTSCFLISIHDHGIGIPSSQRSLVFERFERAENARAFGISGTGLGLYLCRELIEQQGGNIWFSSVEGRGSTFFVTFPISALSSVAHSGVSLK